MNILKTIDSFARRWSYVIALVGVLASVWSLFNDKNLNTRINLIKNSSSLNSGGQNVTMSGSSSIDHNGVGIQQNN